MKIIIDWYRFSFSIFFKILETKKIDFFLKVILVILFNN